jgi:integrase
VLYGRTRQEVSQKLTAAMRDVQRGLTLPGKRYTVGALMTEWLEQVVKPTRRASTYEAYAGRVRYHVLPKLGRIALVNLTGRHIETIQQDLLDLGRTPGTVLNVRLVLHAALDQAVRWDLIPRNPVDLARAPAQHASERRFLDEHEAAALLDSLRGDRFEALYTVAVALGLRRGEALGLQWDDVDLDAGVLRVRRSLARINHTLTLVEPKSHKSRRTIAMPSAAVTALRAHRERQAFERRAAGSLWVDEGLVFSTERGGKVSPDALTMRFRAHLKRRGLPMVRFHDLRHACASLLLAQGVDLKVVQEILGHASYATTANIYAHVMPTLKRDAADRMDSALRWQAQ